jgi:hypothetical protein
MSDTIVITIGQAHRKSLLSNLKNISEILPFNRELADFLLNDYWPPDKSRKNPIKSAIS